MTDPVISAIVAMAENRVIGKNNQMPWHLPADFKHFKTITTGHPIIMGRKTYTSIGKPLPNRINIVVTRNPQFCAPGCLVIGTLEEAMDAAQQEDQKEIFIIGGAEIYRQAFPLLQRIYLTVIHHSFDGDIFFPELDAATWREIAREDHVADDKNLYDYSFLQLDRS